MIMELIHIMGIGVTECIRGLYHRKFDTLSFWNRCMRTNIIYTKFFQSLALNYEIHVEINHIPYEESELLYPTDIQVSKVIGAGLISIVFDGVLASGERVVVKTKRKNIAQRITNSLHTLYRLITWINWFIPLPCLIDAYHEVADNFKTQSNFVVEYNNHIRYYEMFKDCEYIKVPQLYPSECTEERIVMEKLEGISLYDLTPAQKEKCTSWLSKMIVQCLVNHGFVHADLHAGNIMFNDTYIGIIDFGFMVAMSKEEAQNISLLFKEFAMENFKEAAKHTMKFIERSDTLSREEQEDVQDFIIHIYQKATVVDKLFSIYDILHIMKKIRRYQLHISPVFYNMGVGLISIENVLTHLSKTSSDFITGAIIEVLSIQIEDSERHKHCK
jgi:ubiquinone biosynthesis protein